MAGFKNSRENTGETKKYGFAFVILITYLVFEYLRPQSDYFQFLAPLRIPMFLAIALLILFLRSDKSVLKDRLVVYAGLFIFLVGFSVTYAYNTYHVWQTFYSLMLIFICVSLAMPTIVTNKEQLDRFLKYWIIITALLALYAIDHGGHGPGSFLWDENDLALALNMSIPLPFYLSLSKKSSKRQKIFYRVVTVILVIASGSTMSRGGFLGLVAVFGMFWLLSGKKLKSVAIVLLCIIIAGFPVYKLIPDTYKAEVVSILDTGDRTREDRFLFWGLGWDMFVDNPVLGVGAANFPWRVAEYQVQSNKYDVNKIVLFGGRQAHSLYFALMPELGLAGIIIFLLILKQIFSRMRRIVRYCSESDEYAEYALIAKAFMVSVIAYLVTGAFISVLYYPPFWHLIGFVITLDRVVALETGISEENEENVTKGNSYNRNGRTGRRGKNSRSGGRWTAGGV